MSADDMTISVGVMGNDNDGDESGYVRAFSYCTTTNKWNRLGSTLAGAVSDDNFGCSVSMSADCMTVTEGTPRNDDNGVSSGHTRVFA